MARKVRYAPVIRVAKIDLQEQVRQRLRTLVECKNVSHVILGKHLGLSRSAVTRLLNDEGSGIAFTHIEKLCEFFQVTPCELMTEPGAPVQAVSPLEAAILAHVRRMTELERRSLLTILERQTIVQHRKSRLGHSMLNTREQELVDLFARAKDEATREGVIKILRASVTARAAQRTNE